MDKIFSLHNDTVRRLPAVDGNMPISKLRDFLDGDNNYCVIVRLVFGEIVLDFDSGIDLQHIDMSEVKNAE